MTIVCCFAIRKITKINFIQQMVTSDRFCSAVQKYADNVRLQYKNYELVKNISKDLVCKFSNLHRAPVDDKLPCLDRWCLRYSRYKMSTHPYLNAWFLWCKKNETKLKNLKTFSTFNVTYNRYNYIIKFKNKLESFRRGMEKKIIMWLCVHLYLGMWLCPELTNHIQTQVK